MSVTVTTLSGSGGGGGLSWANTGSTVKITIRNSVIFLIDIHILNGSHMESLYALFRGKEDENLYKRIGANHVARPYNPQIYPNTKRGNYLTSTTAPSASSLAFASA